MDPKVATVRPGMGIAPSVILIDPKYGHNAASALRSCAAFGVGQLWITGDRVLEEWRGRSRVHREEQMKSYGSTSAGLEPRTPSYATLAEHRGFIDSDESLDALGES